MTPKFGDLSISQAFEIGNRRVRFNLAEIRQRTLDARSLLVKVTCMNKALKRYARRTTGLLLIALVFLLGMAGANPDLHRTLHSADCPTGSCEKSPDQDSEDSEHICGVTLLQTGALFLIESPVFEPVGFLRERVERFETAALANVPFCLPQGRAPPIAGIV